VPIRYAVYYAPEADTPLWRVGCAWLGRDPETGAALGRPAVALSLDQIAAATRAASLYGFHATLKPPFALAAGTAEAAVIDAARALAAGLTPVQAPPLRLGRLGGFLALVPSGPAPGLAQLAAECVSRLDALRAPAGATELARRRADGLTDRQEGHLRRWGYPYVMEDFRFHLTLTDRLEPATAERFEAVLLPLLADVIAGPLWIRELALFRQGAEGEAFRLICRLPLGEAGEKR
jgi:putative phosphonate metabolism protein